MNFLDEEYTWIKVAPNIALIKYWGKLEPSLNIPLNSSLSITLDWENIFTETSVSVELTELS